MSSNNIPLSSGSTFNDSWKGNTADAALAAFNEQSPSLSNLENSNKIPHTPTTHLRLELKPIVQYTLPNRIRPSKIPNLEGTLAKACSYIHFLWYAILAIVLAGLLILTVLILQFSIFACRILLVDLNSCPPECQARLTKRKLGDLGFEHYAVKDEDRSYSPGRI